MSVPQTSDTAVLGSRMGTRTPYIIAILVFACAAAVTLYFNYSMSGGMHMPGNWTMSMMWMPMNGEVTTAAMYSLMWLAMMVAMMLPSTMPLLLFVPPGSGISRRGPYRAADVCGCHRLFFCVDALRTVYHVCGLLITRGAMHSEALVAPYPPPADSRCLWQEFIS